MSRRTESRRSFLRKSAAASAAIGAGLWAAPGSGAFGSHDPGTVPQDEGDKLNIACIGTANRAMADIEGVRSQNIVALCDIDSNYLAKASQLFPDARTYSDYREMIDAEGDRIDAVTVATADHQHAPATIRAIRAGKHVYCEKPLTHTVWEARTIAQAAADAGVATQMGTQIHAGENYRRVVEVIQSGAIGDVTDVHVWVGKDWGTPGQINAPAPPPAHLNWDLWLGPAAERDFIPGAFHPANWRRWWDFGQGTLGDMACHYMDLPFWALDLRHPTRCEAEGPEVNPDTCPNGLKVMYDHPANDNRPALKLTWYDGNMIPSEVAGQPVPGQGVMFVGTEGSMFADYTRYRLFPADKFADFTPPKKTIPPSIGHHMEWIRACKEGTPTTCNFNYSGALSEAVLLGNVAFRAGKALEWDADNMIATNCPEAQQYINKEYRAGWEV